ncbi:MAG TPA: hypothetical protein VMH05_25570 [Bryobacteraceae bacterium]|nr:hypothetical protein [Bryobacteraceae bacterium]
MKTLFVLCAALSLAYGFDVQEKETIRQTFPAAAHLEVDNVFGLIHVIGYSGTEIQMTAEKTIDADSKDRLDAAKREVKLDTTQSGDELRIYVDGPFRHRDSGGHRGYRVTYDFELKVPLATAARLAAVNHGHIRLEGTAGDFDLSNVNGGIELADAGGSGSAHTVNGKISASFAQNPAANTSFKSVNGSIEASFPPNLAADISVKTLNGGAYTDFDMTALAQAAPVAERRGGKFIYRSGRSTSLRVGAGGPQLKFETVNGSIRIVKRGQ